MVRLNIKTAAKVVNDLRKQENTKIKILTKNTCFAQKTLKITQKQHKNR